MENQETNCYFREQERYTQEEIGKILLNKKDNIPLTETEEKRIVALIKR